jgi:hypothetical protein
MKDVVSVVSVVTVVLSAGKPVQEDSRMTNTKNFLCKFGRRELDSTYTPDHCSLFTIRGGTPGAV